MRSLLQRALGPPLERVFRHFEQSVTLEDHQRFAAEIASAYGSGTGVAASDLMTPSLDEEGATSIFDPALFADADWHEAAAATGELRTAAARTWAAIVTGTLTPMDGDRLLEGIARSFAPRLWFLKRGALYGSADLLRALIRVAEAPDAATLAYTRDVCERFLRHLEVRRDDYLPFREHSRPPDAYDELERLRFTAALLDASERFDDPRFLNAALKANDWHWRALRSAEGQRLTRAQPETARLARLHYAHEFERQEALLHARYGSLA